VVTSVRDAEAIPKVLGLVAARSGSPMVHADIARALAASPDTIRNYLAYLEIVFLTATVPAWSGNLTSKITKTPKVFATDSGLAAHLLRVTADSLRGPGHPALGGLLETFVFSELVKLQAASETGFNIYHLRDRSGAEVDSSSKVPMASSPGWRSRHQPRRPAATPGICAGSKTGSATG
jgi:uncharacterized protein